jgi:hypothetical protein
MPRNRLRRPKRFKCLECKFEWTSRNKVNILIFLEVQKYLNYINSLKNSTCSACDQIKLKTSKAEEFDGEIFDLGENLKNLDISLSRKNEKRRERGKGNKTFECFPCNLRWEDRMKNNVKIFKLSEYYK